MHDVFISHSSLDKPVADAICHTLEVQGIRCWIAPRDIQSGEEWQASIVRAIRAARVFVLVFSEQSNASKQVLREVSVAADGNCVIVPYRIDNAVMGDGLSYFLKPLHWLDAISSPMERSLQVLCRRVQGILAGTESSMPPPLPPREKKKRRWIPLIPLLLAVVLVVVGLFVATNRRNDGVSDAESSLTPPTDTVTENPVQKLDFYTFSQSERYRYPFYEMAMFADRGDFFIVENKTTGKLGLYKTDTGMPLLKRNIAYSYDDSRYIYSVYTSHYDTLYFMDVKAKTICSYSRSKEEWICETPVSLQLTENEEISYSVTFIEHMSQTDPHNDEIVLFVYDVNENCMSTAITVSPDGRFTKTPITHLGIVSLLGGIDTDDNFCLALDNTNNVFLLSLKTLQKVDVDRETLLQKYMPHLLAENDILSPGGRYLQTWSTGEMYVWDILSGKCVFSETFTKNYTSYFMDDHSLVYYNAEDCSLHVKDLTSNAPAKKLTKFSFADEAYYLSGPYYFYCDEKLDIFLFLSYSTEKKAQQLTITDLEGNVLATSGLLKDIFGDKNDWPRILVTDEALILSINLSDIEEKSDFYTEIYLTHYHIDEEGKLIFDTIDG